MYLLEEEIKPELTLTSRVESNGRVKLSEPCGLKESAPPDNSTVVVENKLSFLISREGKEIDTRPDQQVRVLRVSIKIGR